MSEANNYVTTGGPANGTVRQSALRKALADGRLLVSWFSMGSIPVIEAADSAMFDAGVLDLQHGLWDRMNAHLAVRTLGCERAILRVAANTPLAIGEALDTGAEGIFVPIIENAEQAEAAVAASSFPPVGIRSGGGVRPLTEGFGAYLDRIGKPFIGLMIETAQGIANAAQISEVDGVDLVLIGTGDLSLSLGCAPGAGTAHEEACQSVLAACRDAGMPCGIFTTTPEAAARRLAEGFAMAVVANDVDVVKQGFSSAAQMARPSMSIDNTNP